MYLGAPYAFIDILITYQKNIRIPDVVVIHEGIMDKI
jgi:hypothetical protein